MADYLPQQLLISIFLKLPIKTLIQCTSVCKSWHSLITSPNFISTHHHQQQTHLLLRQYWVDFRSEKYSLRSDSESLDEIRHFYSRFKSETINQFFRIIGSCNGLLCLADDYIYFEGTIIVWNPMIRKSLTLQPPRMNFLTASRHLVGFGFDSRTNDYKVVRIAYQKDNVLGWAVTPEISVYSLSTSCWRQIAAPAAPPHQAAKFCESQAYINEAVHWIVHKPEFETKSQHFIMLFDMINEVFGEMMLPTNLNSGGGFVQDMCIAVVGELLSVSEFNDRVYSWNYTSCAIWMMKEYGVVESWTKQLVVKVEDGGFGRILGLRTNGDLLLPSRKQELVSYNPETHQIKKLGIRGIGNSSYFGNYTGSLILIKSVNGASWERIRSTDCVEDNKNMLRTEDGSLR